MLLRLVLDAHPLPKTGMIYLLILIPMIVGLGIGGSAGSIVYNAKKSRIPRILMVIGATAAGVGFLLSLLNWLNIGIAIENTHTTSFRVVAPSLASSLMPLGIGLVDATLAYAIAAALNLGRARTS